MGMPVIRSWQALKDIPIDGILKTSSAHPWAEPDLKAWCRTSKHQIIKIETDANTKHFYIKKIH